MRNVEHLRTLKRLLFSGFSICMTVPFTKYFKGNAVSIKNITAPY